MKAIKKIQALSAVILFSVAMGVAAIPITGEIGMGGNFIAVDSNGNTTSIGLASGIDFDPNKFIVNSATGSFSGVTAIGTIQDFQFSGGAFSSISDFWTVESFSFDLMTITKLASSTDTFLDLQGTGIMRGTGYDATIGSWTFTGDTTGGFSSGNGSSIFSWSAGSTAVPEPAILALMGVGLLGFAVSRRSAS